MNRKISLTTWLLCWPVAMMLAQGPNGSGIYYKNADGLKGAELKTALSKIISNNPIKRSYTNLWTDFQTTDKRSDGKVWDMYSGVTSYVFVTNQDKGSHKKEGDTYNREHSFPKSWFNEKNEGSYMYTDLFHIYPTDSYVNERRGNLPLGETSNPTYQSTGGFSKIGPAKTSLGYTGTGNVFEPNDEYKGDFARTYFYMVTRYEDVVQGWQGGYMLDFNKYPALAGWAVTMLLRWAKEDPVSEKEINRNKAVYGIQKNRNPFIDYPGLEQLIWGDLQDVAFSYTTSDYTGIVGVQGATEKGGAVYSLSGQRVKGKLPKGVYVRRGKKFVVR